MNQLELEFLFEDFKKKYFEIGNQYNKILEIGNKLLQIDNDIQILKEQFQGISSLVESLKENINSNFTQMTAINNQLDTINDNLNIEKLEIENIKNYNLNFLMQLEEEYKKNPIVFLREYAIYLQESYSKAEQLILGTKNGKELENDSEYYHNNAKYFYQQIKDKNS